MQENFTCETSSLIDLVRSWIENDLWSKSDIRKHRKLDHSIEYQSVEHVVILDFGQNSLELLGPHILYMDSVTLCILYDTA